MLNSFTYRLAFSFGTRELVFHICILLSHFLYFVHFGSYLLQWPMIKMLGHYWDGAGEPRGMHKLQDLCILLGSLTPSLWVCRPTVNMRPLLSTLFELPLVFLAFWPMIN
jgi:hypothetical protein